MVQAVEGPMTRSIEDLILMQNVMAGPHPSSYTTLPFTPLPTEYPDLQGMRIAYNPAFGSTALEPAIKHNLLKALDGLRGRGAVVEEVEICWDLDAIGKVLLEGLNSLYLDESLHKISDTDAEQLCSYVSHLRDNAGENKASVLPSATLALQLHREMQDKVWGKGYSAFICATMLTTDLPADQDPVQQPFLDLGGEKIDAYLGWCLTPPFNLLNRYPVIAAPTGLSELGVPTGMQIVANAFEDEIVFRVAFNHAQAGISRLFVDQFPEMK